MTPPSPNPEPPAPPPIPASRRLARLAWRLWPFVAWCGALAAAVGLYFSEAGHGHALAVEDVQEIRVSADVAGRLATLHVNSGQAVRAGDLVATLDSKDLEARIRFAKAEIERSRARIAAERDARMPDARLLPLELELKSQEARAAELEREREHYRISAPVSGSIDLIAARPGEWRVAGAEIVQIVVPRPDRMTSYVTDRQIPVVTVGTRATLRPRDHGGPALEGSVVAVAPRIDQIPLRLRAIATQPQWGRQITIQVTVAGQPIPGEIYDVRFH
jgi:multidrug efflux system membrane fusion protein